MGKMLIKNLTNQWINCQNNKKLAFLNFSKKNHLKILKIKKFKFSNKYKGKILRIMHETWNINSQFWLKSLFTFKKCIKNILKFNFKVQNQNFVWHHLKSPQKLTNWDFFNLFYSFLKFEEFFKNCCLNCSQNFLKNNLK